MQKIRDEIVRGDYLQMKRYFLREFGILPDQEEDCTLALNAVWKELPDDSELVMDPGSYRFRAEAALQVPYVLSNSDPMDLHHVSVLLARRKKLVLNGNGAKWLFHGQTMPISIDSCQEITIRNLTIDWDIPLTAEGRVVHGEETFVDLAIDPGLYPFHIEGDTLVFDGGDWHEAVYRGGNTEFDSHAGKVAAGRGDTFPPTRQELLPDGRVRFYGAFGEKYPREGNVIVLRHGRREHPGVLIHGSREVSLEQMTIYGNGGLGILAQFSRDLSFRKIDMIPNREAGRQFASGHDDGIHLSANSGRVTVEECSFLGLMDDPINLHGIAAKMERRIDPYTILGRFMHPQSKGYAKWAGPGHTIALLDGQDMHELLQRRVRSFELLTPETFQLTLEEALPEQAEGELSLENISSTAELVCRNNYFGSCRARGLLVCTPKPVLVENNIFESAGAAILVAGDNCTWYESGRCQEVRIRNNYFSDCCLTSEYMGGKGIVSICPELPRPTAEYPFHRNIVIEKNVFHTSNGRVLYALCTRGLKIQNNRIVRSYTYPPDGEEAQLFTLEHCTEVEIGDNLLVGDVVGRDRKRNRNITRKAPDGAPDSPLYQKTALFLGDSISYGAGDRILGCGWAGRIGYKYSMDWINTSQGGATIARHPEEVPKIGDQLDSGDLAGKAVDYIVLEGGINDAMCNEDNPLACPVGEISDSADPADLDQNTFAGALEALICQIREKYPRAGLGFVGIYQIPKRLEPERSRAYMEMAKRICQKWKVPYLDLHEDVALNKILAEYLPDNVHIDEGGYEVVTPLVEAWMVRELS